MHVPDLSAYEMAPIEQSSRLIAVGWLEPSHDYPRGRVDLEFVAKLAELLVNPWEPVVAAGPHFCGFCTWTGGPGLFRLTHTSNGAEVRMGVSNLWLPADGFLYVAPSLILHYIDAHEYLPPAEFQEAVMKCPPMRSMEFLKALLKNGPPGLTK